MSAEHEDCKPQSTEEDRMNVLYKPHPELVDEDDQRLWVETHTEEGGAHGLRGVLVLNADGSVGFLPEHKIEDRG